MDTIEEDWIKRIRLPSGGGLVWKRKGPAPRSPSTPIGKWQHSYAKARRVQAHDRGVKKASIRSHAMYLLRQDGKEHEDKFVSEIGDIRKLLKTFDNIQPHYRIVIAPQRGDVLDMERLAKSAAEEVMQRFGRFEYAGAVHEKLQSNGRLNKHIHLIFKAPFDVGAVALKYAFATAAAREATLQFEEKGLHYVPDHLENVIKAEVKHLEKELVQGDEDNHKHSEGHNAQ